MADKKISELTNITGANLADGDELVVVDTSASETKAITFGEFKTALDTSTGFVRITGDTMTGDLTVPNVIVSGNVDGRDVSSDGTKLDTVETNADVTDTANVTAAGALMDSELTSEASVKALDQGVATTDSPTFAGLTTTADITFGDNDKAIFGAGSDLQIFHDPANGSIVKDNGAGRLVLDSENGTGISLTSGGIAKTMISATKDSDVKLYYDNSPKLATTSTGVDITGVLSSDGLTVDGASNITKTSAAAEAMPLVVQNQDSSTSTSVAIGFANTSLADQTTSNTKIGVIRTNSVTSGDTDLYINTQALGGSLRRALFSSSGDISFYEDTGTTAKFFWDASAERLQLGDIVTSFRGGSSSRMVLAETTAAAINWLEIQSSTTGRTGVIFSDGGSGNYGLIDYDHTDDHLKILTAGSEAMRIDSSGNLLVGTTTYDNNIAGIGLGASNFFYATRNSSLVASFNRLTSDGTIIDFRKDGTTVGSIGVFAGDFIVGSSSGSDAAFRMDGTNNAIYAANTSGNARDAAIDLGASSVRWKDLYLSGKITNDGTGGIQIDSSGNVGIGTTNPQSTLHLGNNTVAGEVATQFQNSSVAGAYIGVEGSSGNRFIGSSTDNMFIGTSSADGLELATNNNVRMRIDSSGNVGIGTSSPSNLLHLKDEGYQLLLEDTSSGNTGEILVSDTSLYFFSDRSNSETNSDIRFSVDASEAMRIDSSGNLLVGKTSTNIGVAGAEIKPNGNFTSTANGDWAGLFNRLTSDGDILQFRKDGTTVGSIGTANVGDLYIGNDDTTLLFAGGSDAILPRGTAGASRDAAINLGLSSHRFKDLYLSGGIYLGGVAAANKLEDYEEGTWTPTLQGSTTTDFTYSHQGGSYIKIGQLVYVSCVITITNKGTSAGTLYFDNLPFTVSDTVAVTAIEGNGVCGYVGGMSSTMYGTLTVVPTTARGDGGEFYFNIGAAQNNQILRVSDISDSFNIRYSVAYRSI